MEKGATSLYLHYGNVGKGAQQKEACAGKEIFGIRQPTTCEPVVGKEILTTRILDDQQLDEFLHASTIRNLDA